MGIIFNIQKFCLHDGDGIRTTVFFKGCPLRCLWCHNPEGLKIMPSLMLHLNRCTLCGDCLKCNARKIKDGKVCVDRSLCEKCGKCVCACKNDVNELLGKEVSAQEVFDEVKKDKIFYSTSGGGMTLSGGEPSMQPEFALELITLAKQEGINVAIETCGIGSADFYSKAAELGCTFLFDIKCIDEQKHIELTGVSNKKILENLQLLFSKNADVIIRLPIVPKANDDKQMLDELGSFLFSKKGKYRYAEIMPYHKLGQGKSKALDEQVFVFEEASEKEKSDNKKTLEAWGIDVQISNG